jgi:hypothetical protein
MMGIAPPPTEAEDRDADDHFGLAGAICAWNYLCVYEPSKSRWLLVVIRRRLHCSRTAWNRYRNFDRHIGALLRRISLAFLGFVYVEIGITVVVWWFATKITKHPF